jgi:dCMP deaminase
MTCINSFFNYKKLTHEFLSVMIYNTMGDMADWTLDQIENDLYYSNVMYEEETDSFIGPGRRKKLLKCSHCGKKPLSWKRIKNKWIIFELDGSVHLCNGYEPPLEILKEIAKTVGTQVKKDMNVNVIKENDVPVAGIIEYGGKPFPDYSPPSWDTWFMGLVYDVAKKSKDPSTKIGAVIVRDNRPILFGYNGIPRKVKDLPERMVRPVKYKWTEHGERNALYCGARFGIATENAIMYTQSIPCADCARGIINCGISKIIVHKQTEDLFASHAVWTEELDIARIMLNEAGVEIVVFDEVLGKWSFVNGKVHVV